MLGYPEETGLVAPGVYPSVHLHGPVIGVTFTSHRKSDEDNFRRRHRPSVFEPLESTAASKRKKKQLDLALLVSDRRVR